MHKIKRYANRKLYDVTDKKYITLDQISKLIKSGEEITVVDNKTGKDLTAATVSQILARDKRGKTDDVASGVGPVASKGTGDTGRLWQEVCFPVGPCFDYGR